MTGFAAPRSRLNVLASDDVLLQLPLFMTCELRLHSYATDMLRISIVTAAVIGHRLHRPLRLLQPHVHPHEAQPHRERRLRLAVPLHPQREPGGSPAPAAWPARAFAS